MRVSPLFETLDDLVRGPEVPRRAMMMRMTPRPSRRRIVGVLSSPLRGVTVTRGRPEVLAELLEIEPYTRGLHGKQEVGVLRTTVGGASSCVGVCLAVFGCVGCVCDVVPRFATESRR